MPCKQLGSIQNEKRIRNSLLYFFYFFMYTDLYILPFTKENDICQCRCSIYVVIIEKKSEKHTPLYTAVIFAVIK